jgi:hypothetical protein
VPALSLDSNTVWVSKLPMDFDICIGPMKKKKNSVLNFMENELKHGSNKDGLEFIYFYIFKLF